MRSEVRMKNNLKAMSIVILIGMQIGATPVLAAIPNAHRTWMVFNPPRDFTRGLNASAIQPIESLQQTTNEDVAKIIPHRDLTSGASGSQVATQILDHSLSNFFNSPAVRNSDLGKTATQVEKSMEGEKAFGGDEEGSVRHTFKFAMKAAQTRAALEYQGLTNAELSYTISQSRMNFEIHEDLIAGTKVVFNHIESPGDRSDTLSLRWKW